MQLPQSKKEEEESTGDDRTCIAFYLHRNFGSPSETNFPVASPDDCPFCKNSMYKEHRRNMHERKQKHVHSRSNHIKLWKVFCTASITKHEDVLSIVIPLVSK